MRSIGDRVPIPTNEPVRAYAPGSEERGSLERVLADQLATVVEAPNVVAGAAVTTGRVFHQHCPHDHRHRLATVHAAATVTVRDAIDAAVQAQHDWAALPFSDRAAVFLRAAELLAGPWRDTLNAATILGQSKSVQQAEIDAACELIDFLRFNVAFADAMQDQQPLSAPGEWNRLELRPLEGFVLAITPFNFTAIAGNLPTAPALLGNTVVWKPSEKQALAAHHTMRLLQAAGLPDGVINLVHGSGREVAGVALSDPRLAGVHFTGSEAVLTGLVQQLGRNAAIYRTFPRLVGESGGKDFVLAHPSAEVEALVVGLARGAFEYQGQKCSAASRAYLPRSLADQVLEPLAEAARAMTMGDVGRDLSCYLGAVIDQPALRRQEAAMARAVAEGSEVLVGGRVDDRDGWFVHPTVLRTDDPRAHTMTEELFGPILTVLVYPDEQWEEILGEVDRATRYALTGAVFARDRLALRQADRRLLHTAGNLYLNDKPTGAVVGRQPFGGARRSGTNDKAGSAANLQRWVSPRAIKETFVAPLDWRYPHQG